MNILKLNNWFGLPKKYTGIVEYDDAIYYFLNGLRHREDGPSIIRKNGTIEYCLNGKRHREDGPAIIRKDGTIKYYLKGKYHREDGPAIIWKDGRKEWFLNNKDMTKEVNKWIKENNIPKVWNNSHKILFKLTFG